MKRTQVQLDEPTYRALRARSFEREISTAAVIREAQRWYLGATARGVRNVDDFRFIASGRSQESEVEPISEWHDEALADDFSL